MRIGGAKIAIEKEYLESAFMAGWGNYYALILVESSLIDDFNTGSL